MGIPNALAADSFRLTVPASWYELELTPEAAGPALRAAVRSRARSDPRLRDQGQRLVSELLKVVRAAQQRGAIYVAGMFEAYDGVPVIASVMVSAVVRPPGETGDVLSQLGSMGSREAEEQGGTWRRVLPVDLPKAGPAGRVVGVEDLPVSDDVAVRYVVMHTVIPIPGTDGALVVTCGSPSLPLANELLDLFDAISGTFQFVASEP
jgi:hypothetical protein